MPAPLSLTRISATAPLRCTVSATVPPSGVYFDALLSRFVSIWTSRAISPTIGRAKELLDVFTLGNVARGFRNADHAPFPIADRRYRQRDVDAVAVLGDADRLEMLDALALRNARQDVVLLVLQLRWDDDGDR